MEIHAIQGDRMTHVLTVHRGDADKGPVHLVSVEQIVYWQQLAEDYADLLEKLAADQTPGPAPGQLIEG